VIDVTEILVHWHAGRSQAEIADSLGVDRKTVRKYTAPAIAVGLAPGGAALGEAEWIALVRGWFPELIDTRLRQSSWPAIEVFHDTIKDLLGEVTVSTIHQRLRDEHGLTVSLSSHAPVSGGEPSAGDARRAGHGPAGRPTAGA